MNICTSLEIFKTIRLGKLSFESRRLSILIIRTETVYELRHALKKLYFYVIIMPVRSRSWAHVGCAVAMPEVSFTDVNLRDGINTSQITSARRKLVSDAQVTGCMTFHISSL